MSESPSGADVQPLGASSRQLEFLPDYLHDVKLVEEISFKAWRRCLESIGLPESLSRKDLEWSEGFYAKLEQALFTKRLPVELIDALETTAELGNSKGREVLHQAAEDIGVSRISWPSEIGDRELVLELWLRQRENADLVEVLERARLRMFELGTSRPQREFTGKAPKAIPSDLPAVIARLEEGTAAWFRANDRGEYSEVKALERDHGAVFQVVHGEPFRSEMTISDDGKARSSVRYRPGLADLIRYDSDDGRLRIAAHSSKLVNAYREIFGEALFGDREFFGGKENCTLRPLQEKGNAALEPRPPNMVGAQVIELTWHHDGHSIRFDGDDCLGKMSALNLPSNEGQFVDAKLELRFLRGKRVDRKVVRVQTPNRIHNRPDRYEKQVDAFLLRIGIRLRGKSSAPNDLWSLFPWKHSELRWRQALGGQAAFWQSAGLLIPAPLDTVAHPDHATGPTALRVWSNGELLEGLSADPYVPSRALTLSDVDGYALDVQLLAQQLAAALSAPGPMKRLNWFLGGFDLGERLFGQARVRLFFFARKPGVEPAELAQRLRQVAGGKVHVGIVVPSGCTTRTGLAEVELDTGGTPFEGVLRRLIQALGLEKEASALEQAGAGARLVIDRRQGAVFFDGFKLSSIPEKSQYFKFLLELAKAGGEAVSRDRLNQILGGNDCRPETAKDAKKRTVEAIQLSYRKNELVAPEVVKDIIVTRNGGYALSVPAFVS